MRFKFTAPIIPGATDDAAKCIHDTKLFIFIRTTKRLKILEFINSCIGVLEIEHPLVQAYARSRQKTLFSINNDSEAMNILMIFTSLVCI